MKYIIISLFSFLFVSVNIYGQNSAFDTAKYIGPQNGYLIIIGGGKTPKVAKERFMQLAGNTAASIVYIPTAAADDTIQALSDSFVATYKRRGDNKCFHTTHEG